MLADTLRSDGSPARYPEGALGDFGRELLKAAAIRDRFYAPGLTRRMVAFAARSEAIRRVLGDLVLGEQGYLGLKRRLLRAGPRFLLETGLSRFFAAARGSAQRGSSREPASSPFRESAASLTKKATTSSTKLRM